MRGSGFRGEQAKCVSRFFGVAPLRIVSASKLKHPDSAGNSVFSTDVRVDPLRNVKKHDNDKPDNVDKCPVREQQPCPPRSCAHHIRSICRLSLKSEEASPDRSSCNVKQMNGGEAEEQRSGSA